MGNNIVVVELSHEYTPIHVREKMRLNTVEVDTMLHQLGITLEEVFILSTCNRLAIYAWAETPKEILSFFSKFEDINSYLTVYNRSDAAVSHLFETAGGLRSQVIGEHQILGQIRKAHALALQKGSIGPVLDQLVREAIRVGKRIRTETHIGKYATSVVSAGFELLKEHHPHLSDLNVLVIGTGKIAEMALERLQKASVQKVYIASHELKRARQIAQAWKAYAVDLNDLHEVLSKVSVVIGGTHEEINFYPSQKEPIDCTRALFASEHPKELLLLDFGMPRNFNPALRYHEHIKLYDLDDIKIFSHQALCKRASALPQAQQIIDQETQRFDELLRQQEMSPLLRAYWKRLEQIKEDELNWLMTKLGAVDERQQELIRRFSHKLIRSISREPLQNLRGWAKAGPVPASNIKVIKNLFNLKMEVSQEPSIEIE